MEESFNPVAQTRANYYTPGSPVQFVRVELLKGDVSGDHAVCLTFKNISRVTLTALNIRFKCKGVDGVILCEDDFEYRDLNVQPGELFGMDDAVFITKKAITSVDVSLKDVYNGKRVVHLDGIKRVRLPGPKRLTPELQAALEARLDRKGMKYTPQVLDSGWYCACGAFHPNEEDTVYCSECGSDRILLQNALNTLLQPEEPSPQEEGVRMEMEEEPTRIVGGASAQQVPPPAAGDGTRAFELPKQESYNFAFEPQTDPSEEKEQTRVVSADARPADSHTRVAPARRPAEPLEEDEEDEEDEEYEDDRDAMAENIIRWVPPVTALICAAIALSGFVYYQFFL